MNFRDLVIARNGDSLGGRVLEPGFTITTPFGQAMTFKTRNIRWIHFRKPPEYPSDEIWTATDDRVRGEIRGKAVRFKPVDGSPISIPYSAIHTLIVNHTFSSRRA